MMTACKGADHPSNHVRLSVSAFMPPERLLAFLKPRSLKSWAYPKRLMPIGSDTTLRYGPTKWNN